MKTIELIVTPANRQYATQTLPSGLQIARPRLEITDAPRFSGVSRRIFLFAGATSSVMLLSGSDGGCGGSLSEFLLKALMLAKSIYSVGEGLSGGAVVNNRSSQQLNLEMIFSLFKQVGGTDLGKQVGDLVKGIAAVPSDGQDHTVHLPNDTLKPQESGGHAAVAQAMGQQTTTMLTVT